MALQGRRARLILEYEQLINLEKRSDFIKIEPVNKIEGMPPEEYIITFTCRGIAGLRPDNSPEFAEFHQVSMKLSSNFPNQEPYLKWLTPIWHPNIEHKEPHHVCTNNVQNWFSTKSLKDLVVSLGEMVQYRRYHAEWVAPFPLDKEVADWVIKFAEPNGFLNQEKPVDERQLLRPLRSLKKAPQTPATPARPSGRLQIGKKKSFSIDGSNASVSIERQMSRENNIFSEHKVSSAVRRNTQNLPPVEPVRRRGLTIGLKMREVPCVLCRKNFMIPVPVAENALGFACDECTSDLKASN